MNTNLGLIGRKLGCTQIFDDDGTVLGVTVIEAGPCVVVGKRTEEKDGYSALQLGFGSKRDKLVRKPVAGYLKKQGVEAAPRVIREFRVAADVVAKYEVGQEIRPSDVFEAGQLVDVSGTSKGRGFTGVIRRHNFRGAGTNSHGTHEYRRHGGSIGQNMTPGRTFPGMRMPGRHGGRKSTIMSLEVARVLSDENLVLVRGGVPGPRNGVVTLRGAAKGKPAEA
jgi:large subunit ribosomal protein L3